MRDTCKKSYHYAEGYSTCEKNQGCLGWPRLSGGNPRVTLLFCLYECFAQWRLRGWLKEGTSMETMFIERVKLCIMNRIKFGHCTSVPLSMIFLHFFSGLICNPVLSLL